jgi:hypothetical protein
MAVVGGSVHVALRRSMYRYLAEHYPEQYAAAGRPSWMVDGAGSRSTWGLIKRMGVADDSVIKYYRQWMRITEAILAVMILSAVGIIALLQPR